MKKLTRLIAVVGLTLSFGLVALGGETQAPPCSNNPGETQAPPCSSSQYSSDESGQADTQTSDLTNSVVTEATVEILQSVLSLL
jgi:hypothetical protein